MAKPDAVAPNGRKPLADIRPRILQSRHNRRIKLADAAIAKIFAPL